MRRIGRGLALLAMLAVGGPACSDDAAEVPPVEVPQGPVAPTLMAPVARVETTDRWLDLIAQRPSAVVMRDGGVLVDLGRRSASKHLALGQHDEWRLGVEVDDRVGGIVRGRTVSFDLPLDGELSPALNPDDPETETSGLAMAITLRPLVEDQSVTVLWEEKPLAHLRLSEGWQRRTLSLPAELVHPGDNRMRLHFRRMGEHGGEPAAAVVTRVEVGRHDLITGTLPEAEPVPPFTVEPDPEGGATLELAAGSSLVYYLVPPRRGRLRLDVRGQGSLQVLASSDADHREGRRPSVLFEEPLRPAGDRRELDLTAWGGVPTRLEIRAGGSKGDSGAVLRVAEIAARRSQPLDQRPRAPRDILVLAVEGARADEFFDPGRRPSLETIETMRRESMVFERAYAVGSAAVPSHAGWLSSVAPPVHLTVRGTFVADGQVLLPETLSRAGYLRALVSSNSYVDEERGLAQGFDLHQAIRRDTDEDDAVAVVRRGLAQLEPHSEHWFLYANVNDPQAPYEPPRELLGDLQTPAGAPLPHLTHIWVGRVYTGKLEPSAEELRYVRRLYRGELQVVDRALEELLSTLREAGRLDDAIVVLVGIHGEEFFEHGSAGHGRNLHEESIRVPLLIRAPKLLAPGKVTAPVDLLDLAPTLADLVGAPAPDLWQGESLVPVIDDPQPPPRLVLAYLGDGSRAAVIGDHKLILGPGLRQRYFDLRSDPGELTDLQAEGGVALRMLRTALAWQILHQERWKRARWGTGANLRPAFAMDQGM
ncbi:MAG: sulfatase [Myxococcales bacterium]|nr:sulfatase [Myxococcales bacterium]